MGENPSKSSHWSLEPLLNEGSLDAGLYKALRMALWAYNGTNYQPAGLDEMTRAIQYIDFAHSTVHQGDHFIYTDAVTLNNGSAQDYLLTVANTTKWPHMVFSLDGSAITQFELYEGTDKTGVAAQTLGSSNRNSTTMPGLTIHKGTAGGTTDGNRIHFYKGGTATNQSRSDSTAGNHEEEIILEQNTKYILRVTSGTDGNLTNVMLSWYELTAQDA